jgi:hypothetical protein
MYEPFHQDKRSPLPVLLALPIADAIDAKNADRARAVAFNGTGRRLPLTFIYTSEEEAPRCG